MSSAPTSTTKDRRLQVVGPHTVGTMKLSMSSAPKSFPIGGSSADLELAIRQPSEQVFAPKVIVLGCRLGMAGANVYLGALMTRARQRTFSAKRRTLMLPSPLC